MHRSAAQSSRVGGRPWLGPRSLGALLMALALGLSTGLSIPVTASARTSALSSGTQPNLQAAGEAKKSASKKKKKRKSEASRSESRTQTTATKRSKKRKAAAAAAAAAAAGGAAVAISASSPALANADAKPRSRGIPASAQQAGVAEARLIEIYQHIGRGKTLAALQLAESLVRDHPNFQLAHLIYGDLLSSRSRSISKLGEVPDTTARLAAPQLADLREESRKRIQALTERPPEGTIPSAFIGLSARNRHAIAVDVSRSRLYLLENTPQGLRLVGDYYVSVGKAGVEKFAEGDLRTPLGVYFLNSSLNPSTLKDLYGAGAITLNYPNPLDTRRGKSGSGIWLHGTPQAQFSRAPQATDGCVVVTNSDFLRILNAVELRNTPIVVAQSLNWAAPAALQAERAAFMAAFGAWSGAKAQGRVSDWLGTYAPDFRSYEKTLREWYPGQEAQIRAQIGLALEARDLSMIWWKDAPGAQQPVEAMVLTFTEARVGPNARAPQTIRQYWVKTANQWKIAFEGALQ